MKVMKRKMFGTLPLIIVTGVILSGCAQTHEVVSSTQTTRTTVVTQAPPPPRTEVPTVAPSEAHVWVTGYWSFTDNHWMWMPGHWEVRPRVGAVWVPGHWDQKPDGKGWVWTPGYWE